MRADAWRPMSNVLEDLGGVPDERTDGLDGYAVKLAVFEGPLDLLLHLIRQNEVDITDIPIARIAAQYLATIELMQELDLDIAAEYLVMAATLALIKSRMLLPGDPERRRRRRRSADRSGAAAARVPALQGGGGGALEATAARARRLERRRAGSRADAGGRARDRGRVCSSWWRPSATCSRARTPRISSTRSRPST